jgi:copper chaperone
MSTTTIRIEGMHCDGCAQRVRRVLEREPGVKSADVSYEGGEARVQHDEGAVTTDRLRAVVERAGYTARTEVQGADGR